MQKQIDAAREGAGRVAGFCLTNGQYVWITEWWRDGEFVIGSDEQFPNHLAYVPISNVTYFWVERRDLS